MLKGGLISIWDLDMNLVPTLMMIDIFFPILDSSQGTNVWEKNNSCF